MNDKDGCGSDWIYVPPSPLPSSSSVSCQQCPSTNPWASPTTNTDKEALEHEYKTIYDAVNQLKKGVINDDESASSQKPAVLLMMAWYVPI